jgi:hypothetical protein
MRSVFALFLVLALGASQAQGTDILWLSLKSTFSYRDLSTVCSNNYYPATLYFGAEVEGLEIKKAVFRDSLGSTATKITLTAEEIKDLVLHQDKSGQLWLKTVSMKNRLLTWMFFEAGGSAFSSCRPPQALASIDPALFSFDFKIDSAVEGMETAESNLGKFRGKLKDGAAYQVELQFSEKPYRFYRVDDFDLGTMEAGLNEDFLSAETGDFNAYSYPKPPWARSISAMGSGSSRSSAQMFCQSDARSKVRRLETTCRSNGGVPSSSHPFCSICNQLGSRWRCTDNVRVRCSGRIDGEIDEVSLPEDLSDPLSRLDDTEEVESESGSARLGSPVFSDRQDCRAIAMNNPGLCRNRDCRGVLYHAQSYCQSNDCRAIVRGLVSYCQTRDCRAVIYNNIGFCESTNCRAVIYKNFGMCR